MISQIYKVLLGIGLTTFLSFALVLGIAVESSSATQSFIQLVNFPDSSIATMERVEATAKDLEGKAQEAIGDVTGDMKNQVAGKVKQSSAATLNAAEDLKNQTQMPERMKAGAKDLEGKTQEAIGKVTGDRNAQIAGKAKQADSSSRNFIENVKDTFKGLFN
jgi:uncharacterized protein YjbJ (UPF0337 family)